MQFDELRFVCTQAAVDLLARDGRPVVPTVVLPGAPRTRLVALRDLPPDDAARADLMRRFAADEVTVSGTPCWGFVAEAEVHGTDALVVVYGARRHVPHLTAAPFDGEGLGAFVTPEELDDSAMPFLAPLQRAVDALPAVGDAFGAFDPKRAPWSGSGPG